MRANHVSILIGRFEDLVAHGLRALIASDPNLEIVADGVDTLRLPALFEEHEPRVAVINFGSLRSPIDVHDLNSRFPRTRLVVVANRPTTAECNQLLAFGAMACLSKEAQARDVLNAIHLASRGLHLVLPSGEGESDSSAGGPELLTPREADVLGQLQTGRSNAEIADSLHLGVETVKTHARSIYRKLGVNSRRELLAGATGHDARRHARQPTVAAIRVACPAWQPRTSAPPSRGRC